MTVIIVVVVVVSERNVYTFPCVIIVDKDWDASSCTEKTFLTN